MTTMRGRFTDPEDPLYAVPGSDGYEYVGPDTSFRGAPDPYRSDYEKPKRHRSHRHSRRHDVGESPSSSTDHIRSNQRRSPHPKKDRDADYLRQPEEDRSYKHTKAPDPLRSDDDRHHRRSRRHSAEPRGASPSPPPPRRSHKHEPSLRDSHYPPQASQGRPYSPMPPPPLDDQPPPRSSRRRDDSPPRYSRRYDESPPRHPSRRRDVSPPPSPRTSRRHGHSPPPAPAPRADSPPRRRRSHRDHEPRERRHRHHEPQQPDGYATDAPRSRRYDDDGYATEPTARRRRDPDEPYARTARPSPVRDASPPPRSGGHKHRRPETSSRSSAPASSKPVTGGKRGGGAAAAGLAGVNPVVAERWQKAARAGLEAGGKAAFSMRQDPGSWRGEKGMRIATAALGAAAIDAFAARDAAKGKPSSKGDPPEASRGMDQFGDALGGFLKDRFNSRRRH